MKTIWKYPVATEGEFAIDIPKGAEVLTVQTQALSVQMWAIVDTDKQPERRRFLMSGTGWPLPEDVMSYIGTVQPIGSGLVFHLFELEGNRDAGGAT